MQRFQWGIDHAELGSFEYQSDYSIREHHYPTFHIVSSKEIVSTILMHFMKGYGVFIIGSGMLTPEVYEYGAPFTAESVAAFHWDLIDHISKLIGEAPIVSQLDDGRYFITLLNL